MYLPPSQFEAWFPSLAHGDEHVERTLAAAREALAEVARAMSVLAEVVEAAEPALAAHAVAGSRARALRRRAARTTPAGSCSRRSTRATSCTTARRVPSPGWTTTCGCWPATRSTRWGWPGWPRPGDVAAVAELSDLISLSAQAHAAGRGELAEGLWDASAEALSAAGGPGARAWARDRLPAP